MKTYIYILSTSLLVFSSGCTIDFQNPEGQHKTEYITESPAQQEHTKEHPSHEQTQDTGITEPTTPAHEHTPEETRHEAHHNTEQPREQRDEDNRPDASSADEPVIEHPDIEVPPEPAPLPEEAHKETYQEHIVEQPPKESQTQCQPGLVESCFEASPQQVWVGLCRPGTRMCLPSGMWDRCRFQVLPQREECNGQDDDCNGLVDDDFSTKGNTCSTGKPGPCKIGIQECRNGQLFCREYRTPKAEVCNNVDDDCDGTVDEFCEQGCQIKHTFPTEIKVNVLEEIQGVRFHPDGKSFFTFSRNTLRRWDISTGKLLKDIQTQANAYSLAISQNGTYAYLGDQCRRMYEFHTQTGQLKRVYEATDPQHLHGCRAGGGYSASHKIIALSSYNYDGMNSTYWTDFFRTSDGVKFRTTPRIKYAGSPYYGAGGEVLLYPVTRLLVPAKLAYSQNSSITIPPNLDKGPSAESLDEKRIAVIYSGITQNKHTLDVYEWKTGNKLASWIPYVYKDFSEKMYIKMSGDGRFVLVESPSEPRVKIFDVSTQRMYKQITTSSSYGGLAQISNDGKYIGSIKSKGTNSSQRTYYFILTELATDKVLYTSDFEVKKFIFAPDNKTIILYGKVLALLDLTTHKLRIKHTPQTTSTKKAKVLALKPDGTILAYVWEKELHIQDIKANKRLFKLTLKDDVKSMDFHRTQDIVALLYDNKIELYDTTKGTLLRTLTGLSGIRQGFFQDDGKTFLATSSTTAGWHFWDISTGQLIRKDLTTSKAPMMMSRDGKLAGHDGYVWAPYTGKIYLSGGNGHWEIFEAWHYSHIDPMGTFGVKEKFGYGFALREVLDLSGNKLFTQSFWGKFEQSYPSPYAARVDYVGAHGKLLFLSEGKELLAGWSLAKKDKVGYVPGLQENLFLPRSPIATSKDGTIVAGRIRDDYIRVWRCQGP